MNPSTLEKKLATYALAGGAALALPGVAKADLIYSGLLDHTVTGEGSYGLVLPGAGSPAFTIFRGVNFFPVRECT